MKDFNHQLQDIGLTQREADIYQSLLVLGESPVRDLINETKLHPQIIYRALSGLEEKGLATLSYRRNKQYLSAENPDVLIQQEEGKLQTIKGLAKDLSSLQKLPPTSIVRVEKGQEAIKHLRVAGIEALKKGESYYVIGGSGEYFYEIMGPLFAQLEKKRLKKGVWRRMITYEDQRKFIDKYEPQKPSLVEYRYLPSSYDVVSGINFYRDIVAIIIWSLDPIVITIKSQEVATSYKQAFDNLWLVAKK